MFGEMEILLVSPTSWLCHEPWIMSPSGKSDWRLTVWGFVQAWIQSFAIGSTIYGLRGFQEKDEFEKMDFDAMHRVKHT